MSALTVTFVEEDGTVKTLGAETGQSLMQAGKDAGVAGILADCSGACACATCHVYVAPEWAEKLPKTSPMESDMLDFAIDPRPTSRLSCQISLTPELDGIVIETPLRQG